ncbi:DUF2147 domain-containing protein [Erythrobacter longus]|uniref:DUF2147 domain-containing protein n=1 Tax=Erythrobacter longus TaxID=1044 RepID=UPI00054D8DC1
MIHRLFLSLGMLAAAFLAFPAQALAADSIAGRWVTQDRDAVVEIKQCGNVTCGRIARFLVTPPDGADQRDINNPDANLRQRKLLGLPILTQFREDGSKWRGRIYDPNNGKSYRSVIQRKGANTIEVSGCIGPFCQTQTWRRAR